jgi:hypothetical protein
VLADKFSTDMIGSTMTVFKVVIGMTSAEAVLSAEAPACAQALSAAKPFLEAEGA